MTNKTKTIILLCSGGLLAVLVGFGVFVFYLLNSWGPSFGSEQDHEPDDVMIKNFVEHRAQFEELRSMLVHDGSISRIDENWTDPADLQQNVVADYRRRFKELKIPRGVSVTLGGRRIVFIASAPGWVAAGSTKAYVYMEERPDEVETDLDHYLVDRTRVVEAFRRIDGNWYLYFERY